MPTTTNKVPRGTAKPHRRKVRSKKSTPAKSSSMLTGLLKKDQLSMKEIMLLWVALGGPATGPKGAAVAAAVAYQENGGKTKGCTGCCCGLWMYNVIPVPSNPCSDTIRTPKDAENVLKTTRCTIKTVKASGWGPWEAHPDGGGNYGNYYGYLAEAKKIYSSGKVGSLKTKDGKPVSGNSFGAQLVSLDLNPLDNPILDLLGEGLSAGADNAQSAAGVAGLGDLAGVIADVTGALFDPQFWLRVGKVLFGAILLFMAANALAKALFGLDLTAAVPAAKLGKAAKGVGSKVPASVKPTSPKG